MLRIQQFYKVKQYPNIEVLEHEEKESGQMVY